MTPQMSILEMAIIVFILCGIGWVIWRGGASNPIGTGALERKVQSLSTSVGKLDTRVGHVEAGLAELKEEAATTQDIKRLEELGERTYRSVDRIERIILEKGMK